MNISIIGSGYVGLVTGVCFANVGHNVSIFDIDKKKINQLKNKEIPFYEPVLEDLLKLNINLKRLTFSTNLENVLENSEIIFICVGTPQNKNGSANLSYVFSAIESITKLCKRDIFIAIKSTVPIGTAKKAMKIAKKHSKFLTIIISNPEFLKEGDAVRDFMYPDRVVIGTANKKAKNLMNKLYKPFVKTGNSILFMDNKSAEMTKYASNCLLASRISFMNEIANLCDVVEANVDHVRLGVGSDKRLGNRFLFPGVGYGGSCFPKDIRALIDIGKKSNIDMQILKAIDKVNNNQKHIISNKIFDYYKTKNLLDRKFSIWGLSFKPNTNDMREAASITIINDLLNSGAKISVFDPQAMNEAKTIFGTSINYAKDMYTCCSFSDALIIVTEWDEFKNPNFDRIKQLLLRPLIFDGRNIYNLVDMKSLAFEYFSIGRSI
jgi:UDPglucose 6-dehydrogenase